MKLFTLKTPNGCKAFCSELCFTQCRRASFKKNKICDWCKHVRHTVNYVDFQDGEQQLQFCSDKCLNQYKMNIFCKETQAHLQMHTHLKEAACKMKASGSVNLITPELWLRDCKVNGLSTSPLEAIDSMDGANSDENLSAIASPTLALETSRPSTPVMKEKKEQKQDLPPPLKERDKPGKKSSKSSPKKNSSESKSQHSDRHFREKKSNGMQYADAPTISRQSPIQASPSSHTRTGQMTNGTHSLLSPPPLTIPRPPPHVGSLPPRHCPPPVPSPLGMGGMEHGRQPFMHQNMMPPPFQFLAQQQMEAMLRSQHGLDLRSKAPPHMPIPPWVMPPFPPVHPPPQPPLPPPISSSRSPSLPHSSPPARSHHQTISHRNSHHGKHKHSKRSSGHSTGSAPHPTSNLPMQNPNVQFSPSLLPPVTVMVPFPLVLPLPLPIPVPIPIPPDVMEKYKKLKQKEKEHEGKDTIKDIPDTNTRKRKLSHESTKNKRNRRISMGDASILNISLNREMGDTVPTLHQNDGYYDRVENLSVRKPELQSVDYSDFSKTPKMVNDAELESRSYSPLSEGLSSNDEDEDIRRTLKNGDIDAFPAMNFSTYNLNLTRSSPVSSQANERDIVVHNSQEFHKSPSPTNLSVKERQHINVSSSSMSFKKKHLREQLSLMT